MSHIAHLNALRSFAVAARHLNFTHAARDLQVSPSAVSHQIKLLESYLQQQLFMRQGSQLVLTPEGEFLFQKLDDPFRQIGAAIAQVKAFRGRTSVNLLCRPFFSSLWLTPRLRSLWTQHPNLDLSLIHQSTFSMTDFERVDLAILWGKGDWDGLDCTLLVDGNLTPIMGRRLAQSMGVPETPADLQRFTLLHEENKLGWARWLEHAGAPKITGSAAILVDDTNVRLQHVLNGQGIMLSCPALLQDLLASGDVIRPFDTSLDSYSYYLTWPKNRPLNAQARQVVGWLRNESGI